MPAAWAGVWGATCFTYVHVHVSGDSQNCGQFVRSQLVLGLLKTDLFR